MNSMSSALRRLPAEPVVLETFAHEGDGVYSDVSGILPPADRDACLEVMAWCASPRLWNKGPFCMMARGVSDWEGGSLIEPSLRSSFAAQYSAGSSIFPSLLLDIAMLSVVVLDFIHRSCSPAGLVDDSSRAGRVIESTYLWNLLKTSPCSRIPDRS